MTAWRAAIAGYGDPVDQPGTPSFVANAPDTDAAQQLGAVWFGGVQASGLIEATNDPAALEAGGWWAVLITFEGECRFWRFEQVDAVAVPTAPAQRNARSPATTQGHKQAWVGPPANPWRSSLDRCAYLAGVAEIRRRILEGDVYQVNLCRVLTAGIDDDDDPSGTPWALAQRLSEGNPAPYAGVIDVPALNGVARTRLVTASPELFLGREGDLVTSGPIKGTGATEQDLTPKDDAENVMIVDLVRNDLQRVSLPGSVEVTSLLRVERHPGLVHLVSTVQGRLGDGVTWADILAATLPAGSISGAPKSSALRVIADLEPVPRGPYCGAIGFIDADRREARLAVGIRTFWWQDNTSQNGVTANRNAPAGQGVTLNFGTGAGITWDSDPVREWAETELKAARLIGLASSQQFDQVSSRATAASRSR